MKGLIFADLAAWIDLHTERLHRVGKGELADLFDEFRTAYFTCDDERALALLPTLRTLTHTLREPLFGYVLTYYDAMITIYWLGDLRTGLRRVMAALVRAWRDKRAELICFYLVEVMAFAWLEVDGRGYQYPCEAIKFHPKSHHRLPEEIRRRLRLLRAVGWTNVTRGDPASDILSLMSSMEEEWPESYRLAWRAKSYYWQKQYTRAVNLFRRAVAAFEQEGQRYDANETRLHLAELYRERGEWGEMLTLCEEILVVGEALRNEAHRGTTIGFMAAGYEHTGAHRKAAALYQQAVDTLEPLGWERQAAEFALARYRLCLREGYAEAHIAGAEAERIAARMAADDLYNQILSLL